MSTSEKSTNDYGTCPCGKGRILQHVDSPDNPWSRTRYAYELDCAACRQDWVVVNDELRNRAADAASSLAYARIRAIDDELKRIGANAIDQILADLGLRFKEEHLLLKAAGICTEGPIRYKRARERGTKAGAMCTPHLNIPWIVSRVKNEPSAKDITALGDERAQCQARARKAREEMNTLRIPPR